MGKTEDFQNRVNERIGFMFNFVGVLIGLLALFLTAVHFCEYEADAVYLKVLYFFALFSLAMCLFFGFCVMAGPIFENSHNFMKYNSPFYSKKAKKCLSIAYDFFGLGLFAVISIVVFIVFKEILYVIIFDIGVLFIGVVMFINSVKPVGEQEKTE